MKRLHAAIAGIGFVGRAHLDALRRLNIPVVGVLGSTPDKGRRFAEAFGIPRAYADFAEVVADPIVDVVHVCTPNHLHFAMASAAMHAGKHVVCEKPLALNADESRELMRIRDSTGRVCAVCFNQRYYPLCHEARARIRSGQVGEIRMVHGEFLQDWLFSPSVWSWRLDPAVGGALRTVGDIGSHWLDLVEWITGLRVAEVCADLATFIPTRRRPASGAETFAEGATAPGAEEVAIPSEDYAAILLGFSGGARGSVTLSQVCPGRKNRLRWEISGQKASMWWDAEDPNRLHIGHADAPNEALIKSPVLMTADARPYAAYPAGHAEGYPDTFARLFQDVYAHIAAGHPYTSAPFPTVADGHRQVVLCEAIGESARLRRWVAMESTAEPAGP